MSDKNNHDINQDYLDLLGEYAQREKEEEYPTERIDEDFYNNEDRYYMLIENEADAEKYLAQMKEYIIEQGDSPWYEKEKKSLIYLPGASEDNPLYLVYWVIH